MKTTLSKNVSSNLLATAVIAVINLVYVFSFTALVFNGELAGYFQLGISVILLSYAVSLTIMAAAGSLPGLIVTPKGILLGIVSVLAVSISARLQGRPEEILATLLICLAITTFLSGFFFLLMGMLRLGHLIRFMPIPVIIGYFAGIGFLLIVRSLSIMTDTSGSSGLLADLIRYDRLILWGPGAAYALAGWLVLRRTQHYLALPLITALGVAAFYGVAVVSGLSLTELRGMGLLMPQRDLQAGFPGFFHESLENVDWGVVVSQSGSMLSLVFVGVVSILIYISLTEAGVDEEIDLEKDLKSAGIANMLLALFSGVVCFHTPVDTRLAHRIGGKQRLTGLALAGLSLLMMAGGTAMVGFFPKPIMGGLILLIGLDVLTGNLGRSRRQLTRSEFGLVVLIAAAVVKLGVLAGVGIGILVAFVLFIVNYSAIEPVKVKLTGRFIQSRVERSHWQRRYLKKAGEQTRIFILQGYLFFGSAERILSRVKQSVSLSESDSTGHVRFIVLDFNLVGGIDASAINVFRKLARFAARQNLALIMTGMNQDVEHLFSLNVLIEDSQVLTFQQLDYALEWCEDQLLKERRPHVLHTAKRQPDVAERSPRASILSALRAYGYRKHLKKGEILFRKGEPAECLYLIESGSFSIRLNPAGQQALRLRKMGRGTILGEIGYYNRQPRSAMAVADDAASVWVLPGSRLDDLEKNDPQMAGQLHKFILKSVSRRMAHDSEAIPQGV